MVRRPELLLLVASLFAARLPATEAALQPFSATYAVEWKGVTAGYSTLELHPDGPDTWVYRSRNVARGIFRLAFPDAITQTSRFRLEDGRVVPLEYVADDGSKSAARDVHLTFDWSEGHVAGVAEGKPVREPLREGTQDSMSVQIALKRMLVNEREPESFWLIDKRELKEYVYTREGSARLETALGPLDTVIYRSQRPGSERVTRTWHAPSLGYLPVRAERVRGGRIEWAMKIRQLKSGGRDATSSAG